MHGSLVPHLVETLIRPAGTSVRVPLGFAEPGCTSLFTGALAPLLATLAFPPESAPADSLVTTEGQAHRADVLLSESVDGCVPLT